MWKQLLIDLAYLVAAALFIYGLKGLTAPRTAVRGNILGAIGMGLAVAVTLCFGGLNYVAIAIALLIGSALGAIMAVKVQMTQMPQMVALLNGFGGLASVLVGGAALFIEPHPGISFAIATALTGIIGGITFTGSLIAFAKLQELMSTGAILLPQRHTINIGLGVLGLVLTFAMINSLPKASAGNSPAVRSTTTVRAAMTAETIQAGQIAASPPVRAGVVVHIAFWVLVIVSLALGVLLVIPIGGADMPVVIALLNSYSGIAAAASGFVIRNDVLIISGSLVGASGVILTAVMCKAMNRSLVNVLFAVYAVADSGSKKKGEEFYAGRVKSTSADEIAMLFDGARRVVIVPGYGLAVAQAQHLVKQMTDLLQARGVEVEFGIHPVAGRMPGHMNVLLAEAEIPYDLLKDMDTINPTFAQTDVAVILGANDVVNPAARNDPNSPIAGMPILNVDQARTVIVVKRSLSPGFAGIPNPLFVADNTLLFFNDGKKAIADIIEAIKSL